MRAVGVTNFGGPEALEVVELPDPAAGPGQVLIRVLAATVNPTDTYTRNGARAAMLQASPPPYVPGMDAAGIVLAIGPDTPTNLRVGDKVMAVVLPSGSHGGYSEQLALPWQSVVHMPRNANFAEAATLPMNALTARLSLDQLALTAGQTLLVTGAAGCYGGYVVQLAKADGLTVVADASEADRYLVEQLGADVVLGRGDDLSKRVRHMFPDGVDACADGAVMNDAIIAAVRDGGGFASVRTFQSEPVRGITFHTTWVRDYIQAHDKLDRLREQAEAGVLTLRVAAAFPPDQAAEAHRRLETGGTRGRFVIEF